MQKREHWGSSLGFILAAAGSAVGLGSLWRFPYYTGEYGGGLFVLCYIIFTFLVGLPVFMGELVIGRHTQRAPVGALSELSNNSPNWRMVAWSCISFNFIILSFYSVVAGWGLNYALLSMCQFSEGRTPDDIQGVFDILYTSGDINTLWHCLFMLLTVGIIYGGVRKGIEYWSKILMPALLLTLFALFFYSMTLSGAREAYTFVLYPDTTKFNSESVMKALGMAFFTLSLGLGIVLTYGSYMRKTDDIPRTSLIISFINLSISIIASLMIFPIIFTFGFKPAEGPGLVFKVMPVLFDMLKGGTFLATTFFMVLVFTALTSSISLIEVMVANFIETLGWSRKKSAIVVGLASFTLGIPSALAGSGTLFADWETMFGQDFFVTISNTPDMLLAIGGFCMAIFSGWYMDEEIVKEEFCRGSSMKWLYRPWRFLLRWVAPLAILLIAMYQSNHDWLDLW